LHKVVNELKKRAPAGIEFKDHHTQADLVISQAIGARCMDRIAATKKPFVVIQFCVLTAGWARRADWVRFWRHDRCRLVVSYYEISHLAPRFLLMPLGADFSLFRPTGGPRPYTIMTSGHHAGQEPIDECHDAAGRVKGQVVHLGGNCYRGHCPVDRREKILEGEVARLLAASKRVSALRWVEGFEMLGIEGLAAGARPVVFDLPCYRRWYGQHAAYVPHDRSALRESLVSVFRRAPRPVSQEEREALRKRFSWDSVARTFWKGVQGV